MDAYDKLIATRMHLLTRESFYGHLCLPIQWSEESFSFMPENLRTMGVVVTGGLVKCCWYRPFVENHSVDELYGVIQHELEHLLRLHCQRSYRRDRIIVNLAADMSVNGRKDSPKVGIRDNTGKRSLLSNAVYCPDDWPHDGTLEYYYDRLIETAQTVPGEMIDVHDLWDRSDMSPDEIRQTVHRLLENAIDRARGCGIPPHIAELLKRLAKPIVSWQNQLALYVGQKLGNHRLTYAKRSRRNDAFGVPGATNRAAAKVTIIVDTSGSITTDDLQQFFAEIESISYRARISLLQWDYVFRSFSKRYRRGDWKNIKIVGRGGTSMDQAVDYVAENRLAGDVCILLTDGETAWPKPRPFSLVTVITKNVPGPSWGKTIYLSS